MKSIQHSGEMNLKDNFRARLIPSSTRLARKKYTEPSDEEMPSSTMIEMNGRLPKQEQVNDKDQFLSDVSRHVTVPSQFRN